MSEDQLARAVLTPIGTLAVLSALRWAKHALQEWIDAGHHVGRTLPEQLGSRLGYAWAAHQRTRHQPLHPWQVRHRGRDGRE